VYIKNQILIAWIVKLNVKTNNRVINIISLFYGNRTTRTNPRFTTDVVLEHDFFFPLKNMLSIMLYQFWTVSHIQCFIENDWSPLIGALFDKDQYS
jgi:hypothetical protein